MDSQKRVVIGSVIIGTLLTIAVVTTAVLMLRGGDSNPANPAQSAQSEAEAPEETVVPSEDSALGQGGVGKLQACPANSVAGVELDCLGEKQSSARGALEGVSVINVWAWWCGPCRDELPLFEELSQKHPEWNVVGVHADQNANNGAGMLGELGVDIPSYQDSDGKFAGKLGLPGVIPITVVVRDGEMLKMFPRTFTSVAELEESVRDAVSSEFSGATEGEGAGA